MAKGRKNRSKAGSEPSTGKPGSPRASSTPGSLKQSGGLTQAERLARYQAALERGQAGGLPAAASFDELLSSPVKGNNPQTNFEGKLPDQNATAMDADGGPVMGSVGGPAVSTTDNATPGVPPVVSGGSGSGVVAGLPGSGKPEMGPAAKGGNVPKGKWKGKLWSQMSQEELDAALEQRKAEHKRKIDDRDHIQAEWCRKIHPVVNDENPGEFQRILKTMGINEDRIRQQSILFGKLLDEGQKTLALLLWCQARDSKNELIRYISGDIVHCIAENGDQVAYDPEAAMSDSSMKIKVLQLLVQLGKTLTKREILAEQQLKAAELAKKQARWSKNPNNPNRSGGKRKGEGVAAATGSASAPKQQKPTSKKSPSE